MSVGGQTTGNQPFGGWKGEVDSNGVEYGKKLLNPKSERGTKESEENKTHASKAQQLKGEKKIKRRRRERQKESVGKAVLWRGRLVGRRVKSRRGKGAQVTTPNLSRGCVMGVDALQNSSRTNPPRKIKIENKKRNG